MKGGGLRVFRQGDDLLKALRPATAKAELSRFRTGHRAAAEPECTQPATQPATEPTTAPTTSPAYKDSYVAYGAGMILDAMARPVR